MMKYLSCDDKVSVCHLLLPLPNLKTFLKPIYCYPADIQFKFLIYPFLGWYIKSHIPTQHWTFSSVGVTYDLQQYQPYTSTSLLWDRGLYQEYMGLYHYQNQAYTSLLKRQKSASDPIVGPDWYESFKKDPIPGPNSYAFFESMQYQGQTGLFKSWYLCWPVIEFWLGYQPSYQVSC